MSACDARDYLLRQFDTAWKLAQHNLDGLTTEECLWQPAARGPHVSRDADGRWSADWPDHEGYDIGPASIAWISWHMIFWWSMLLDHSFGPGSLARTDVFWPGSADSVRRELRRLHDDWRGRLAELSDEDLRSSARARWPLLDAPFGNAVAWATVELVKNASEIGYARFLYAGRKSVVMP